MIRHYLSSINEMRYDTKINNFSLTKQSLSLSSPSCVNKREMQELRGCIEKDLEGSSTVLPSAVESHTLVREQYCRGVASNKTISITSGNKKVEYTIYFGAHGTTWMKASHGSHRSRGPFPSLFVKTGGRGELISHA